MAGKRLVAKCIRCFHTYPTNVLYDTDINQSQNTKCKNCGSYTLISCWIDTKRLSIRVKYKVSAKGYDTHPLDGGFPFGSMPGDSDYGWLHDKDNPGYGKGFGPLP